MLTKVTLRAGWQTGGLEFNQISTTHEQQVKECDKEIYIPAENPCETSLFLRGFFSHIVAGKCLHVFTHLPSSLQHTMSSGVEKHPHYFHHDGIFAHSQYPTCHASLKILDEVNWVIKTLQMGSWRSMIKKRVGPSLPHWLPPHPLYFRKPDNRDKEAG